MAKRISLTQGKRAVVDDKDYGRLSQHKWHAIADGNRTYAGRNIRIGDDYRILTMHRDILKPPSDVLIDHIDFDGLNNRRKNLRKSTVGQNTANTRGHKMGRKTSKYKGVYRRGDCWGSQISVDGVTRNLGTYKNEREAARAYNKVAKKQFGRFAYLNKV